MQVTLLNKALRKIIIFGGNVLPWHVSEDFRRSVTATEDKSDAIGKFSTQQNFQGHQ